MENSTKLVIEFTLVYNRYKSGVYFYIYKMLNNKILVEDIVQDVFIKFFENLEVIRQKESSAAWIYKTARNEVYQHLRQKKADHIEFEEADYNTDYDFVEQYENKEIRELISRELDSLPVDQKEVYLLKEYSGLSYKEIASIQNVDEDLIKSRLFKVRQKLIKRISKLI